jgi:hypothetical protein
MIKENPMEENPCWEYCRLYCQDSYYNVHEHTYTYDVKIWFMGRHGDVIEREISNTEQSFAFDPWLKAICVLGGCSWELVTVKIGSTSNRHDSLLLDNQIAYFKRLVVPGSPIDNVALNFTMSGSVLPLDSNRNEGN